MNRSKIKYNLKKRSVRSIKKPNDPEKTLWLCLRNKKLNNMKFMKEHRIFFDDGNDNIFFIADFYCEGKKLIIKLDEKNKLNAQEEDEIHENTIKSLGYKIIKFNNEDIIDNIGKVIKKIKVNI